MYVYACERDTNVCCFTNIEIIELGNVFLGWLKNSFYVSCGFVPRRGQECLRLELRVKLLFNG